MHTTSYAITVYFWFTLTFLLLYTAGLDPPLDRDELLDQDDYMHQPNHNISGINANFLKSISGWMDMTADDIMDRIGTLDKPDPHVVPP